MKFASALFLVLLFAQSAFAEKDVLQLIQKTSEGKEVMDNLFLQVQEKGHNFNAQLVNGILKSMEDAVRTGTKNRSQHLKQAKAVCKKDIKQLRSTYHDLARHALAADRHFNSANHRQKRRSVFLARAVEELAHYELFRSWVIQNREAWKRLYKTERDGLEKTRGWLATIDGQLKKLGSSFVQLPEEYTSTLAQTKSEFNLSYENVGGLRPIISNLFELIETHANLSKTDFRQHARNLIRHIIDRIGDIENEEAEENERQVGLFESLENLFSDAIQRSKKLTSALGKSAKEAEKKLLWLRTSVKGAGQLADTAKDVIGQRAHECRSANENAARMDVRSGRFLSVLGHIRDIITERWGLFEDIVKKRT